MHDYKINVQCFDNGIILSNNETESMNCSLHTHENKKVHTEYLYAQLAQFLNDKQKSVIQFSNSVFQLKPIRFAQLNQQMEKTEIHRKKRVQTV